jgi:hypothetical protein
MNALADTLIQELRHHASRGAAVPDLLRLLHQRLGREAAYGTTLAKYFMAAFCLPLQAVSPIGGWTPETTGGLSDAEIQAIIYPEIMRTKSLWQGSGAADGLGRPADPVRSGIDTSSAAQRWGSMVIAEQRLELWHDVPANTDYYHAWEPCVA